MNEKPKGPWGLVIGIGMFICGIIYMNWASQQVPAPGGATFFTCVLLFGGIIVGGIGGLRYFYEMSEYNQKKEDPVAYQRKQEAEQKERIERAMEQQRILQAEKEAAERSQLSGAPWERYYTYPCPYCGHYKVRPANWDDKKMSVAFWGPHAPKAGKRYKCDHCKQMWN